MKLKLNIIIRKLLVTQKLVLTPWSRVLTKKLTVTQLFQSFPTSYGH